MSAATGKAEGRTVAVLMGGWSAEREVSLMSGDAAAKALEARGWAVKRIDVTRDLPAFIAALTPRPDVVFNALHGTGGEDGTIHGVLDMLGLPYTHSGLLASAVAMDKPMTKVIAASIGIRTAKGAVRTRRQIEAGDLPMGAPFVVKPAASGSSVGVMLVQAGFNRIALAKGEPAEPFLIEEYVHGRELTCGVMGDRALTVTEIQHTHGFFDYEAKYVAGHARHVLPAPVPAEILAKAKEWALAIHQALGCRGISRSDLLWDERKPGTEGLYFLEVNTQPGFTPISLVPEQAEHCGISFGELCEWLLENALCQS